MPTRWLIGLASGSSADGVDAALVEAVNAGLDLQVRLLHALHQPYGRDLQGLILRAGASRVCDTKQLALLHRLLGETFAAAARQVADRASFRLQDVQCIGCPGHPAWHEPEGRFPSTLGIGMAAVVAERTGITTVSDFRARDVAAGGQGVPLTALADFLLFHEPGEARVLLHLGGAARVVYLPPSGRVQEVIGFEAGPCNGLLDALMRQLTAGREGFDAGGKHAVQGRCLETFLQRWLVHPYFQKRPPKCLSRYAFAGDFACQAVEQSRQERVSLHDLLCTATHFVVRGITASLRRFLPGGRLPDRVLLCGGGVRNGLLLHLLGQHLPDIPITFTDDYDIPATARKAVSFAILAALALDGVPANVPSATGAAGARLLGSITPGSSANWARCLSWMAAQTAPLVTVTDEV